MEQNKMSWGNLDPVNIYFANNEVGPAEQIELCEQRKLIVTLPVHRLGHPENVYLSLQNIIYTEAKYP